MSHAASRESSNYSETSIYVGTENDIEIMLENIISTNGFSAGEGEFWLRTSKSTSSMHVQLAWFGRSVNTKDIGEYAPVLPALHLDLSSVLFASAAEAASSSSSKNTPNSAMTENTYTLRYESTGSETATISTDGMSVTVVNAEMNYHLMVQNGEGVYELLIEDDSQVIRASEIKIGSSSLENFDNCKVWVESTDADRITTAKLATTATDDSTGTTGATGTTGTTGTTDTTDTTTTYVPAAWVPTDPADIYRYSLLGPEAPFYKVLSSVDSIQMVKEIQGPLFFDAVELIQGDYKLARTYNIFVNNTLTYDNGNSVKIELQIPQDLQKEGRTFRMFGVTEDGKNFVLEDLDTDPTTITFAANRFYAFALGYID